MNEHARTYLAISGVLQQAANNCGTVPDIARALMTATANLYCLASDETLRAYKSLIRGDGQMCKIHRMFHNTPKENYRLGYFLEELAPRAEKTDTLNKLFWHQYLVETSNRLVGLQEPRSNAITSYLSGGNSVTQYTRSITLSDGGGFATVDVAYQVPKGELVKVGLKHSLEEIEVEDLSKLTGTPNLDRFNKPEFFSYLDELVASEFKDLPDCSEPPKWLDLLVEGTYDDIVITVNGISYDSREKVPVNTRIGFRKDLDSRITCTIDDSLLYLLGTGVSCWGDLPYYLQRLLSQLEIDRVDSYVVDWYLDGTDIRPDNLTAYFYG